MYRIMLRTESIQRKHEIKKRCGYNDYIANSCMNASGVITIEPIGFRRYINGIIAFALLLIIFLRFYLISTLAFFLALFIFSAIVAYSHRK